MLPSTSQNGATLGAYGQSGNPSLCYRFNTALPRRASLPASGVFNRPSVASGFDAETSGRTDRTRLMQQQPESSSSTLAVSPAPVPGAPSNPTPGSTPDLHSGPHQPHAAPRWLIRVELFLRVLLRMYIGIAICYAPWSHAFWDQNPIFLQFPTLATICTSGAVRGIVSGLGLLNLWIAFHDAIRHRDG